MNKQLLTLATMLLLAATLHTSCSKDDKEEPPKEATKTELLTKASWKFDKIEPALAGGLVECFKDNSTTFSTDGKGVSAEGANLCTPPTGSFNWNFLNNETTLHLDAKLLPVGNNDFTIETLNETTLVLTQNVTTPVPATVKLTLKH
jgi:hypothetical protein